MSVCSAFYFHFRFTNFLNILFLISHSDFFFFISVTDCFKCYFLEFSPIFFLSFNFLLISHFIPISFFPFPCPIFFLFMSVFFLSGPSLVLSGSGHGHVISVISNFFFALLRHHASSSYDRIRRKCTTEYDRSLVATSSSLIRQKPCSSSQPSSVFCSYGRIRQKPSVFFLTKNNSRDKQKGEINPL